MKSNILVSIIKPKNQAVNKNIRICIECGSFSIHKEDHGVYCKECGKFFDVKEDSN